LAVCDISSSDTQPPTDRQPTANPQEALPDIVAALDAHQGEVDIQTKGLVLLGVLIQVRVCVGGGGRNQASRLHQQVDTHHTQATSTRNTRASSKRRFRATTPSTTPSASGR
jgi:hypothetical protein